MRSTLLAVLLLVSFNALGQQAKLYHLGPWNGGTNNVAATSTNTVTDSYIAVSEFDTIGVAITLRPVSTSTGTVVFNFAEAIGDYYETTPSHSITVTLSGTNTITTPGNFTVANAGTFALVQTVSTNAMGMTNVIIEVRLKAPKRKTF